MAHVRVSRTWYVKSDVEHENCQEWVNDFVEESVLNSIRPPRPVVAVRNP